MNKPRTKIYVKITPERNEIVYSGIEFAEFIKYLPQPIENLMIITGGSNVVLLDTKFERGLEQFEGHELVEALARENVHNFGNFCFVDYISSGKASDLNEEQIAELLYLGHMFKPLDSPFFEPLQNRFVYLAHDDGWYCKLYCREISDFLSVLCGKLTSNMKKVVPSIPDMISEQLIRLATSGILIDLDETSQSKEGTDIGIYTIGECLDMDCFLNDFQKLKDNASKISNLQCNEKGWTIS